MRLFLFNILFYIIFAILILIFHRHNNIFTSFLEVGSRIRDILSFVKYSQEQKTWTTRRRLAKLFKTDMENTFEFYFYVWLTLDKQNGL